MIVRMSKVQAEAVSGLIEDWVDRDYSDEDWLWGFEGELEGGSAEIRKEVISLGVEIGHLVAKADKEEMLNRFPEIKEVIDG
tara:strand:- start:3535 stop:3780 length:246 start_codon:yes stop_codon:yes gene_type:complete